MAVPYTLEELEQAQLELVRVNGLRSYYIRPMVLRGYGTPGVLGIDNPIETYMACWEWGQYLGAGALAEGVDVCVSSWNRIAPDTLPALAKAAANYMNSQLIRMQAQVDGYAEAIALDESGRVSEGSGENIFVVRDGRILTPPVGSSALPGITRDSILTLAHDHSIPVVEAPIPRELLYIADEIFFTGTAAEVTPIRSVDRIQVGAGRRGPITERLQSAFFDIVTGNQPDTHGWLTHLSPVGGVVVAPRRTIQAQKTGPRCRSEFCNLPRDLENMERAARPVSSPHSNGRGAAAEEAAARLLTASSRHISLCLSKP